MTFFAPIFPAKRQEKYSISGAVSRGRPRILVKIAHSVMKPLLKPIQLLLKTREILRRNA
jgi:hypothetical protein